jgi:hypothetical protein
MGYIPDDIIFWHIKHVVKGHGKLGDTQRSTQVTTSFGYSFKDFPSEFMSKLLESFHIQPFHVRRIIDRIQNWFGRGARVWRSGWARVALGCVELGVRGAIADSSRCKCRNRRGRQENRESTGKLHGGKLSLPWMVVRLLLLGHGA